MGYYWSLLVIIGHSLFRREPGRGGTCDVAVESSPAVHQHRPPEGEGLKEGPTGGARLSKCRPVAHLRRGVIGLSLIHI
eukprot:1467720-Pyramimonas_sp.AAC.1